MTPSLWACLHLKETVLQKNEEEREQEPNEQTLHFNKVLLCLVIL